MKNKNNSNQIFDSNRRTHSEVFYDVFLFGNQFKHLEISENLRQIQTENGFICLDENNQLLFNGQVWSGELLQHCIAYPKGKLDIVYTNIPRNEFIISDLASSAIKYDCFGSLQTRSKKLPSFTSFF